MKTSNGNVSCEFYFSPNGQRWETRLAFVDASPTTTTGWDCASGADLLHPNHPDFTQSLFPARSQRPADTTRRPRLRHRLNPGRPQLVLVPALAEACLHEARARRPARRTARRLALRRRRLRRAAIRRQEPDRAVQASFDLMYYWTLRALNMCC